MAALSSTILSFLSFAVTLTLSRPATPTSENNAPSGFQHLVQPHTWLNATFDATRTVTGSRVHLQVRVPPVERAPRCWTRGWGSVWSRARRESQADSWPAGGHGVRRGGSPRRSRVGHDRAA